ncbi:IclR family transcriptional regulator [Salinigranum rubrum]|uniref:IclR family transcriptional regulator n=1 Tax=Salinigranum rubrum TaxID=755307 RepID=A0A2I8VEX3_9EURY|nr:IclR family transcriptional regulator [Salinigranum rubrum]AUV80451.1 IclR family transcriptional regulator [Salinigranum rubrum]
MSHQAKNPVQSIVNTFAIVEALRELDGAGVSELAAHLDTPKSTVHNYLSTLEQEEYIVKEDGVYQVGIRFLELGAYARNRRQIFEIAKPEIDRLAAETGELANLLIEEHGRGTYLQRVRGENAVQVEAHVGTRVSLHSTALGKAILAFMPRERVDEIIDRHGLEQTTPKTVSSREELYEALEDVRDSRYALDDEERIKGLRCVAAPILSNDDRVLGAVSVSGPSNRIRGTRFREELPNKVLEAVNVIELNVTYS